MNAENDKYLWAWKQAGIPDATIAEKLNLTVEQVKERYDLMVMAATRNLEGAQDILGTEFNLLCLQYQQLGERLKVLGAALGNHATAGEISECITGGKKESTINIMNRFVVLKPLTEEEAEKVQGMVQTH